MSDIDKFINEAKKALDFYSLGKLMKDGLKEISWKGTDDLLLSSMDRDKNSGLFLPPGTNDEWDNSASAVLGPWVSYKFHFTAGARIEEPKPDSSVFEMNMVDALIGWREWHINKEKGFITGVTHQEQWLPEEAIPAKCKIHGPAHPVPGEFCSCGFYALDARINPDRGYGARVYGEVYGWGRYVRGENGWRCQYAYPKCFHACEDITPDEMDILKKYRVPIYMEQPILMYNPEEDGYEHRNDETNWNFGSSTEPDAGEETDESDGYVS